MHIAMQTGARFNARLRRRSGTGRQEGNQTMLVIRKVLRTLLTSACLVATLASAGTGVAAPYKVITNFHGRDGKSPYHAPTVDSAGNVYVSTVSGGPKGLGNLVKVAPERTLTVLHAFEGSDGANPYGGVLVDESNGTIYGTTSAGGSSVNCSGGCGVLYSLDSSGHETVLHNFDGTNDGYSPVDAPWRDQLGNLYGVAEYGGAHGNGYGTVWKQAADGTFTVLHTFAGPRDGAYPSAGLLVFEAWCYASCDLFGTTRSGGAYGYGSLFSIDTYNGDLGVYHSFDYTNDGGDPSAPLVMDEHWNFYGTTSYGGAGGAGTIYKYAFGSGRGTFSVVHSFGSDSGGGYPESALVLLNHKLYGTTASAGDPNCGCGTIFEAGLDGSYNVLHAFAGQPDGAYPYSGLAAKPLTYPGRYLYGVTSQGGTGNAGTIYRIKR